VIIFFFSLNFFRFFVFTSLYFKLSRQKHRSFPPLQPEFASLSNGKKSALPIRRSFASFHFFSETGNLLFPASHLFVCGDLLIPASDLFVSRIFGLP
jgi:hypothetical protein